MIEPRVLSLTQLFDVAQSRNDELIQLSHRSSSIIEALALLHFELVAVLGDRLAWLEFRLCCRVVELGPEVRDGEDGVDALEENLGRWLEIIFGYLGTGSG